ncbi:MAG: prolipoprotein diacylglyceryl transferase [Streptococcaceae bacterium]|jgi:phosphatidylglycerol:prolipoprotein diacylglycerol transferase|nr:prolipoprotein diacylglyceryl transferase [Streptococcaceae bacterium]MCH4176405.1 prolipoprotein diacylglyceryl transferase [Streptococcaceae bacterium]
MLFNIDPIALRIFGLEIHWYAVIILAGAIAGVYLAQKEAVRQGLKSDDILDFILITFPIAIIGARIYYVLFDLQAYRDNPLSVFAIWQGGLAIYGGLIAGFICLLVFTYYRVIPRLKFLDIATPSVILGQAVGRWGNFVNQEAYGEPTSYHFLKETLHLPDFIVNQMKVDGVYHQPTFLYESVWNLVGFAILMLIRHQKWIKSGQLFAFYLVWYGIGRFFIEGLRTDSLMIGNTIRVSQVLSLVLVVVGIVIFGYLFKKKPMSR